MPPYKHLERYRQIVGVLADEGLDDLLDITGLRGFQPVRRRRRTEHGSRQPVGLRLRRTLERLGPTFVKFGQVASTRPDLIPEDIVTELRALQDSVTPFPDDEAFALIERELDAPLDTLFADFERTPMAAASLGQVYAATLPDGTPVVVKIQRPNVEDLITRDLDILMAQSRFVETHSELGARYKVSRIAEEFTEAVRHELDYLEEASNAERLGEMFDQDETVVFPRVFWEFTTKHVLTLGRLEGLPFNRPEVLSETGHDRSELAKRGIYCYLEQIFMHGFYHADPHPGNLFALEGDRVGFTDFGRCGTISTIGRNQLADLFIAIIDDDTPLAVDTLFAAAGSPGEIDVAELERKVSRLITKFCNKSLGQIQIGDVVREVMDLVRGSRLMLSSELAMLLTTLVVLEGLGRLLDPTFDFIAVTTPFARKLTEARMEPAALSRSLMQSARRMVNLGQDLPESLARFLRRAGQGEFRVAVHPTGFEPMLRRFEESVNRLSFALVVAAFVVGLSMLLSTTQLPAAFVWIARFFWAAAFGVGSWFFVSALDSRYRHR